MAGLIPDGVVGFNRNIQRYGKLVITIIIALLGTHSFAAANSAGIWKVRHLHVSDTLTSRASVKNQNGEFFAYIADFETGLEYFIFGINLSDRYSTPPPGAKSPIGIQVDNRSTWHGNIRKRGRKLYVVNVQNLRHLLDAMSVGKKLKIDYRNKGGKLTRLEFTLSGARKAIFEVASKQSDIAVSRILRSKTYISEGNRVEVGLKEIQRDCYKNTATFVDENWEKFSAEYARFGWGSSDSFRSMTIVELAQPCIRRGQYRFSKMFKKPTDSALREESGAETTLRSLLKELESNSKTEKGRP